MKRAYVCSMRVENCNINKIAEKYAVLPTSQVEADCIFTIRFWDLNFKTFQRQKWRILTIHTPKEQLS
jgi:hypothetical protein